MSRRPAAGLPSHLGQLAQEVLVTGPEHEAGGDQPFALHHVGRELLGDQVLGAASTVSLWAMPSRFVRLRRVKL